MRPYKITRDPLVRGSGFPGQNIIRRSDGVTLGRVWREGKTWVGRAYIMGGGTSKGDFKYVTEAADFVVATYVPRDDK